MRNLFRGWLLFWRLRGETRARRKARQWSKEALTCLRRMQRAQKELDKFQRKQEVWFEDIKEEINKANNQQQSLLAEAESAASDCEKTIKRFDQIEDNYNHELKVYREIIIPQLTLASEVSRQQLEAEIALQTRRQVYYASDAKGS